MLALFVVAFSVGLDNFGAATALGISGVDRNLRIRAALVFGLFEGAMPVIGLVLGRSLTDDLGGRSNRIEGGLLCLVGAYAIVSELTGEKKRAQDPGVLSPSAWSSSVRHLASTTSSSGSPLAPTTSTSWRQHS